MLLYNGHKSQNCPPLRKLDKQIAISSIPFTLLYFYALPLLVLSNTWREYIIDLRYIISVYIIPGRWGGARITHLSAKGPEGVCSTCW